MGILDWLKHAAGEHHAEPNRQTGVAHKELVFDENEQHLHGLDMKGALDAHRAWKGRLEAQIRGETAEKIEVSAVAVDHNCTLGKWLHSEGKQRFERVPEFEELLRDHANFHLAAGEILVTAHEGKSETAAHMLKTDFRHHSDRVQLSLVRLFAHARRTAS